MVLEKPLLQHFSRARPTFGLTSNQIIVCENGDYLAFGGGGNFALHLDKYFKNRLSESSKHLIMRH